MLRSRPAGLTASVGADELLHQCLAEIFLAEVALLVLVLVQNVCVVDGDVDDEPDERIEPLSAASAELGVRLALAESVDAAHGFYVHCQRQDLRTRHRGVPSSVSQ